VEGGLAHTGRSPPGGGLGRLSGRERLRYTPAERQTDTFCRLTALMKRRFTSCFALLKKGENVGKKWLHFIFDSDSDDDRDCLLFSLLLPCESMAELINSSHFCQSAPPRRESEAASRIQIDAAAYYVPLFHRLRAPFSFFSLSSLLPAEKSPSERVRLSHWQEETAADGVLWL